MKRSNTAIEEFISTYGPKIGINDSDSEDNETHITIMDDLFEHGDDVNYSFNNKSSNGTITQLQAKKSRFQVLSDHQDYAFMKLVAGAMMVDVEMMYEHEDMDRAIQTDYDLQLIEKKRLMAQENKARKVQLKKDNIIQLKKQLINEDEKERIEEGHDLFRRLSEIVEGTPYRYDTLASEYNDYDIVLNERFDKEALMSFMERFYALFYEQNDTFAAQFSKAGLKDEDLKRLALQALWHRDIDPSREHHPHFVDSLTGQGAIKMSLDQGTVERLEEIKQEIVDAPKHQVIPGLSVDAYKRGLFMATPDNFKHQSQKNLSYPVFMTSLIEARDDVMERNDIVKGVNLTSIHVPELNGKIESMKNPSVIDIIDKSKEFFKELYYTSTNIVQQYVDMSKTDERLVSRSVQERKEELLYRREILVESRQVYENIITPILTNLAMVIVGDEDDNKENELINKKKLVSYANRIEKGDLSRDTIISSLIVNNSFMEYYMKVSEYLVDINLRDKKMASYLSLCRLFLALEAYVPEHDTEIRKKIMTNEKELALLLNEEDSTMMVEYVVPKNNIPSTIQLKPGVEDKIDEAYQLMVEHCPNLYGLPLVAVKSKRSIDAGLGGDFARYVAVLFADANLLFPDAYKSKLAHEKIILRKGEMMARLKKYSFTRCHGGAPHDCYSIYKDKVPRSRSNAFYFI